MNPTKCPTCGSPLPKSPRDKLCPVCVLSAAKEVPDQLPNLDEIQDSFPELEILECIGRGGMGIVYKARQTTLNRIIALKLLDPGIQSDPSFEERFIREAQTLAKLNHPNIVSIMDYGQNDDFFWLTMEYVDGINLRDALQTDKFTVEQSLEIIPNLCMALQFAHDKGITHRDIKPENILLDSKGNVKIVDFGIARLCDGSSHNFTLTGTGTTLGSTSYAAPEQIERPHIVDHRADIYSLGVVFYEMLTGELPIGRFAPPSEKSQTNSRIDAIVFKTLEKERELRHQEARDLSDDLANAQLYKPFTPQSKRQDPDSRKSKLLPAAGILLMSSLSAFLVDDDLRNSLLRFICIFSGLSGFLLGALGVRHASQQPQSASAQKTIQIIKQVFAWLLILGIPTAAASLAHEHQHAFRDPKGHWFTQAIFVFILTVTLLIFFRKILLPSTSSSTQKKLSIMMGTLALIISTTALYHSKRHDGLWPAHGHYGAIIPYPRNAGKTSASLKEDYLIIASAIHKVAAKDMTISERDGKIFLHYIARSPRKWTSHANAFIRRYNSITPAHLNIVGSPASISIRQNSGHNWVEVSINNQIRNYTMMHLYCMSGIGLAGLFVAFTSGRVFWFCVGTILISSVILRLTPVATPAISPPVTIVNSDIPPSVPISRPAPDFSTPEKAAQSVFDAAAIGNNENFRKGLSSRMNRLIDERNIGERLLERYKYNRTWAKLHSSHKNKAFAHVILTSPSSSGKWRVILENGVWRLDDLPLDLHNF